MKSILLLSLCSTIWVSTAAAQDTLKVNFKPAGAPTEAGWDSILVADRVLFEAGPSEFDVFGGTLTVTPVWGPSPEANNVRAVNRTNEAYTGPLADVLRSYIAVDSRYTNECDFIGFEISGLPEGRYTWKSYHHDFSDQHGSFTSTVTNGTETLHSDPQGRMVSHSLSLAAYNAAIDPDLVGAEAEEYSAAYATSSLDSVTTYEFKGIVSSGESDVIMVILENVLDPSADMGHGVKFVLINGFELYESDSTDVLSIRDQQLAHDALQVVSKPGGYVSIAGPQMSEVVIYAIDGKLIREIPALGDTVEFTNLRKGIYMVQVMFTTGNTVSRKILVR